MNHPEFHNTISANAHSRREYMFIGKLSNVLVNPEGIVCENGAILHIIPSGLCICRNHVIKFGISHFFYTPQYFTDYQRVTRFLFERLGAIKCLSLPKNRRQDRR